MKKTSMPKRTLRNLMLFTLILTFILNMHIPNVNSQETVETVIKVVPSTSTVGAPGEPLPTQPFTITITVENVANLYAWQVRLYYNATILDTRTDWIWLPPDHIFAGEQIIFPDPVIDSDEGGNYAQVGATLLGDTSVTGSGTLFQMNFTGGAEGTSALQFSDTVYTFLLYPWDKDYDGFLDPIPYVAEDGSVTVSGTVVEKEPSEISINVEPLVVAAGADVSIYGAINVTPVQPAEVTIKIVRVRGDVTIALNTTQTDVDGNYTFTWKTAIEHLTPDPPVPSGVFNISASWRGDETYEGAISEIKSVTLIRPEAFIVVKPESLTVGEEDELLPTAPFTINITVINATDLFEWQVKVRYDSSILQTELDWIWIPEQDHVFEEREFTTFTPEVGTDEIGSYVKFGAKLNQTEPPQETFSGNATLFQINFTGQNPGSSEITFSLEDTFLKNSTSHIIPYLAKKGGIGVKGIGVKQLKMSVVNPETGDSNFKFNMETTPLNSRFNATIRVEDADGLFGWQVKLTYNETLIDATQVWRPTWSDKYVFHGRTLAENTTSLEEGAVILKDVLVDNEAPFDGSGLLAKIEFEIIKAAPEGETLSTELRISHPETQWFKDGTTWLPIKSRDITDGYYEYKAHPSPGPGFDIWAYLPYMLGAAIIIVAVVVVYFKRIREKPTIPMLPEEFS